VVQEAEGVRREAVLRAAVLEILQRHQRGVEHVGQVRLEGVVVIAGQRLLEVVVERVVGPLRTRGQTIDTTSGNRQ